ncbi:ribulokinase [Paenibacillus montaniterrae]|uniref:Ribulokinase n=1 Tax=Paenibacillus montaniterrae TaxID=429341 RepID=A0A920CY82_9BACL|nr:ribulokinase [Paenibacillus montaniterrae]GIP17661.1 ribulokinase [Paenibacillus montaniterrae]
MEKESTIVAGVDFGSDSVRVIMVEGATGTTLAEAACHYPRWSTKQFCNEAISQFRQHPLDYIEAFTKAFKTALNNAGEQAGQRLRSIGIDTTGSTPCPIDENGVPLALKSEFSSNPNAMFHLWKDHTAVAEAEEINTVFSTAAEIDYTRYQGTYSSEWFWAKILHTIRSDEQVKQAAYSWLEHCDWFVNLLLGQSDPQAMYRSSCAAGHKALWHSHFQGLPADEVLLQLDPYLLLVKQRYGAGPSHADTAAGTICKAWAAQLGVNEQVVISGSSFDAHAGAVGAGIQPRTLVKVVGTSTVDMMIEQPERLVGKEMKQICGIAEHSIVPGYVGIEAGQAAFGDIFAWFKSVLMWPLSSTLQHMDSLNEQQKQQLQEQAEQQLLVQLEAAAKQLPLDASQVTALDWFNGRRYPVLNENVKGVIAGLNLGSTAPAIYQSLIAAAVFGAKRIFDSFLEHGLSIDRIIIIGGIAKKSPYIMQMMSDVLGRPIMISKEDQVCAKGAAIYGAVACGLFPSIEEAQRVYCEPYETDYDPDFSKQQLYESKYKQYLELAQHIEAFHSN